MLENIKKELIKQPNKIVVILEHFGFCYIKVRPKYIQFGRDCDGSGKSIVIRLENNERLFVNDYPRNICCDFFSYIIKQKRVEFKDVLNVVKNALGITDYYNFFNSNTIFGGFYDSIKKHSISLIKTYDQSILEPYKNYGNLKFLNDNIILDSQLFFGLRYDVESQSIVIPIYDQLGNIMGVKSRVNYDVEHGELKYYYLIPCTMSQTLYGYSHNYEYLVDDEVYIFESEKSVMQCYSMNFRNSVALGSSSMSNKQCKMILELRPKRVIFMHDQGLEYEVIEKNMKLLKSYAKLFDIEIGYWDYSKDQTIPLKASASDLGMLKFNEIINSQIVMLGENAHEENI